MNSVNAAKKINIRPAAIAGRFYPDSRLALSQTVNDFLEPIAASQKTIKAMIVPHAGYIYSGATAAKAYGALKQQATKIKRVILLGPAHRVYVKGIALSNASHFATPLGNIPIDKKTIQLLSKQTHVNILDEAHAEEHSLEVHLPFLQKVIPNFELVPIVVGDISPENLAPFINDLWGCNETLIVISSDLSHFHQYEQANKIDSKTCNKILQFQTDLTPEEACGCRPVNGLLHLAKQKKLEIELLERCNSGDTAGDKQRVVGYASYLLYEKQNSEKRLTKQDQKLLFQIARDSIQHGLQTQQPKLPKRETLNPRILEERAVFVTLNINNQLRGCIGTTDPREDIATAVARNAFSSAFKDHRFHSLTQEEYEQIDISLSILTPAKVMSFKDETDLLEKLEIGKHGLIIEAGNKRATFLPIVWEQLPRKQQFLSNLKQKAGMTQNETVQKAWTYTSDYYSEHS